MFEPKAPGPQPSRFGRVHGARTNRIPRPFGLSPSPSPDRIQVPGGPAGGQISAGTDRPGPAQGRPLPRLLTTDDLRPVCRAGSARPPLAPLGLAAPWIRQLVNESLLWVLTHEDMALSQVDERNELPDANVIARLELQQGDSREAECTPNSPAACRAAIVHTLQCGIDDGANSSSLLPVTGMSAAQGTRRSTPAALGVSGALQLSASLAPSSQVATARKPVEARPSRAHRGLLRDVTTVP